MNIYLKGKESDDKGKVVGKKRLTGVRCGKCHTDALALVIVKDGDNSFLSAKTVYCELCTKIVEVSTLVPHS